MKIRRRSIWVQTLLRATNYIDRQITISGQHSSRVAYWSARIGCQMGCSGPELQQLYWAGLFHDVGKVIVPRRVLTKTSPLSELDWHIIRMHPGIGANMICTNRKLALLKPIVLAHQEKYDGSGYPGRLREGQIPVGARILAVADSYDAITSERVYRQARPHPEAIEEIRQLSGIHFDPLVVNKFIQLF